MVDESKPINELSPVLEDGRAAAELTDQTLIAVTDLERLHELLSDASVQLLTNFVACERLLGCEGSDFDATRLDQARRHLREAITAMQFPDMASQVLVHASKRLRLVADRLAAIEGDRPLGELVHTACPVGQREMDAGSVELF